MCACRLSCCLLLILISLGPCCEAGQGAAGQERLQPNFTDNVFQPVYAETPAEGITEAEKRLYRHIGVEVDVRRLLSEDTIAETVVSLVQGRPGMTWWVTTLTILPRQAKLVHAHYDPPNRRKPVLMRKWEAATGGDVTALDGHEVTWHGTLPWHVRDSIAQQLNDINYFYLKSCRRGPPAQPAREILVAEGSEVDFSASSNFRAFIAYRDEDGSIYDSSFRVSCAATLADIRYERLCYVFRDCVPFQEQLKAMQESFLERVPELTPSLAFERSTSPTTATPGPPPEPARRLPWAVPLAALSGFLLGVGVAVLIGVRRSARRTRAPDAGSPAPASKPDHD